MELGRMISTMAKNVFWVTTTSQQRMMIIINYHQSQRSSKDNDYASGSGAPCLVFSQAECFADLPDFIFIIGSLLNI